MQSNHTPDIAAKPSLFATIWNPRMLICILIGFSSGLPLYFLLQLVPAWLRREGVDLTSIGFIGLALLPYSWKFLWSPLLDRFSLPSIGRRRTWMLASQLLLLGAMAGIGLFSPANSLSSIVWAAFIIAVFSATQDIAIDAYRREILPDIELGIGNSFYVNAYRVAGLIPGGLGLIMADFVSWPMVFMMTAAFMLPGILCTLLVSEPTLHGTAPKTLQAAIVEPFREFFTRDGVKSSLLILAFMLLYKFGDSLATALITPFYIDVGFTNTQIGAVAKLVGFWSMIIGGFLGGLLMIKIGINRALWVFGFVQFASIFGFALLNEVGNDLFYLGLAVAFEYLGVGLGTAAFVAFIASKTNKKFSATQFALFSSFFAIPRSFTGVIAGYIVETLGLGWTNFFLISAATAIPGMILLYWVAPWNGDQQQK
ncbi:MAG: AmpG family muropeptide MFS transporter [Hyphomicrobiaceae bacterium]|nr:AmpG family muropeptide MFS transporter [Hyphomicrobiaceae bacterium]